MDDIDHRPTPDDVQRQLALILSSHEFASAARLRRFLEYVIQEEQEGRADRIKAYAIAVNVLNRNDSFDPQVDPAVRIEAGRLRRALDRYYVGSGREDPVRIEIPKGTYVPRFSFNEPSLKPRVGTADISGPAAPASWFKTIAEAGAALVTGAMLLAIVAVWFELNSSADVNAPKPLSAPPSLLMLPLSTADGDRTFGEGFTADILANLTRYTEIFVFAPETSFRVANTTDVTELGEKYGARYVLRGSLVRDEQAIHIGLQLLTAQSARVIWAQTFRIDSTASSVFAAQANIANQIVTQIAEPYGAIGAADFEATRGKPPSSMGAYECVLQAYEYRRRFDLSGYEQAQDCLMRAVRENPSYADAWAMLALMYVDRSRFVPMDATSPTMMQLALEAANRAKALAPESAAARRALVSIHFFRQEPDKGFSEGERALQLNPNSAEALFELGLRHVLSGDDKLGLQLLNRALLHNPAVPEAYYLAFALGHFRKGDLNEALAALRRVPARPNYIYWAIATAIYGKAGTRTEAETARTELLKVYPAFPQSAMDEIRRRSIAPDLATSLLNGWRMAGIAVRRPNS